jgi:hypothetical protein
MAILTGAITALTLAGTPGHVAYTPTLALGSRAPGEYTRLGLSATPGRTYGNFQRVAATGPTSRAGLGPFTRLMPSGTPSQVYGAFIKAVALDETKFVTDTIVLVLTDPRVSNVDIDVNDIGVPRVTDSRAIGQGRLVSDTIRPRVTDTVQFLLKAGTIPKAGSDSIVPVVTDAATYIVAIAVTDTVVPVIDDTTPPVISASNAVIVSDTIVPILEDERTVDAANSTRDLTVVDVITPVMTDSATNATAGEVDIIDLVSRPYGIIRLTEI